MAPGLMVITPPDMLLEMGHSSTVARRNVPPSKSRTARLSCSRLNLCVVSLGQGASRAARSATPGSTSVPSPRSRQATGSAVGGEKEQVSAVTGSLGSKEDAAVSLGSVELNDES